MLSGIPDPHAWPVGVNLALFAMAASAVWVAGTRLARLAHAVGERTGLSGAFLGMVLLGVATSLPEIATTVSAALLGNARLVSGNLFGGVALQVAVLAIVDFVAVKGALTFVAPQPFLLFQGVMLLLLLALALAGAVLGEPLALLGVGLTPLLVTAGYLITVRTVAGGSYVPRWQATHVPEVAEPADDADGAPTSSVALAVQCAAAGAVILAAGWSLARTGDALADQTGLGASFVGVALLAASTSLPELSTTLGAVRVGRYDMAVSNILGTNCLEVALFLPGDIAYRDGPLLAATDQSGLLAATVGMVMTCLLLLGLLERRDQTVFGMGLDSFAMLVVYGIGLAGFYHLR